MRAGSSVVVLVAGSVLVADQISKWLVATWLPLDEPLSLVDGLVALTYVHNRGMAFGLFRDVSGDWLRWALVAISLIAVGLIWSIARRGVDRRAINLAFGAVLGGAAGNLLDRLRLGYVVDFIDLHWGPSHWPAFNVADAAITMGGIVLFLALAREHRERDQHDAEIEEPEPPGRQRPAETSSSERARGRTPG